MPIFNVQSDTPYTDAGNVRRTNYAAWVTNSTEAQRIKTVVEQATQGMGYVITTNNVGNLNPVDGILRVLQSWDEWPSDPGFKRFFFEGALKPTQSGIPPQEISRQDAPVKIAIS